MTMRLEVADTDSARRTLALSKFSPKVSMSGAESRNKTVNKSAIRLESRLDGFKKVSDNEQV